MPHLTENERRTLLNVARTAIADKLEQKPPQQPRSEPTSALRESRGCFVSLHIRNKLRGCIGIIEALQPLIVGVAENAVNAAFCDPRFSPLTPEEFKDVTIEISVLTLPQPLEYEDSQDLLHKLIPQKHGVIISRAHHRSTFLPQVWEQLPNKKSFLECLCQKAGLSSDAWQDANIDIKVYEAEHFSEDSAATTHSAC